MCRRSTEAITIQSTSEGFRFQDTSHCMIKKCLINPLTPNLTLYPGRATATTANGHHCHWPPGTGLPAPAPSPSPLPLPSYSCYSIGLELGSSCHHSFKVTYGMLKIAVKQPFCNLDCEAPLLIVSIYPKCPEA